MKSSTLLTLLSSILYACALTDLGLETEPDVHPAPELPSDFINAASQWPHRTPLLSGSKKVGLPGKRAVSHRRAAPMRGYWNGWQGVKYIFSFGDSYTSTGFNISAAQPKPGNPLGNPPFPGHTSSNGPNYISYLTAKYNRSFIETYNLGYGGALVDKAIVMSPFGASVRSFKDQVNQEFQPRYTGSGTVPWKSSDSLFIVFFGINDALNTFNKTDSDNLQYAEIKAYENLVNQLYTAGARNFLFLNVPPVDRAPCSSSFGLTGTASLARWIGNFNFRLAALVWNLTNRHPDIAAFQYNVEDLFTSVLEDPTRFPETAMYRNTTSFCGAYSDSNTLMDSYEPSCGVPVDQYLWLNDLHPTYPMHNFLASQIALLLQR